MLNRFFILAILMVYFIAKLNAQDNTFTNVTINNLLTVRGGATEMNGWGFNFSKQMDQRPNWENGVAFHLNHHFGLTFSAHSFYGGIRFYNQGYPGPYQSADGATMAMSITDGNVGIGTAKPMAGYGNGGLQLAKGGHASVILGEPNQGYGGFVQTTDWKHRLYLGTNLYDDVNSTWRAVEPAKGAAGMILQADEGSSTTEIGFFVSRDGSLTHRMGITADGNVGIGTATPTEKLDVEGTARARRLTIRDNWDNFLSSEDNGNTHHLIGTYRGWDSKAVYVAGYNISNNPAYATERVYIGHPDADKYMVVNFVNGGVGIGTTKTADPNYRLFVEKGIRTRKVRVDVSGWADHVFEPTYKLSTLQEVELFIKVNKHLPEVPSAKDVAANGIDVAETQATLLKKIEELTLYAIEANKKNQELEQRNQVQLEMIRQLDKRLKQLESKDTR